MAALRLLVVEGNTAEARVQQAAIAGTTISASYAAVLKSLVPDAHIDICYPADEGGMSGAARLAEYDGIAITGSALNIWKAEPASLRQVELAREAFSARVPFFGSCWGLQVAAVAAGGDVRLNPKGREIGFARKITLTEEGSAHPLHHGRSRAFDAPTVHSDVVTVLPADVTVTAANAVADVQAAEIRYQGGTFWGVQYHPEYTLRDVALTLRRYRDRILEDGLAASPAELDGYIADVAALHADPSLKSQAWRLGLDRDVLDPAMRLSELANWITAFVCPEQSRRVRA